MFAPAPKTNSASNLNKTCSKGFKDNSMIIPEIITEPKRLKTTYKQMRNIQSRLTCSRDRQEDSSLNFKK